MTDRLSSLYLLPVEMFEKVVDYVAELSTVPDPRGHNWHADDVRRNLLALSRIERMGGSWMYFSEQKLWQKIIITNYDSNKLRMLAEMEVSDVRFGYVQVLDLYQVREDREEPSPSFFDHYISPSNLANLAILLPRVLDLSCLALALTFPDWDSIYINLLSHKIQLETLWLYITHDVDGDETEQANELARESSSVPGIPTLVDLSVISYNATIPLEPHLFQDIPMVNLKRLDLSSSEFDEISQIFHLFPSLQELTVGFDSDVDLFSCLPRTLQKLTWRAWFNLAEQFQNFQTTQVIPIYISHLHLTVPNYSRDPSLLYLSILPASVDLLTLEDVKFELLLQALGGLNSSGGLKRLIIFEPRFIGPVKELKVVSWDGIEIECERLGIELSYDYS